jgi:transcriptional regulator with XRE-family HTH domain
MNDILVLVGVNEGQRVRLTRLAKGLRQIDLASLAGVNTIDITRLENGRYVLPVRRKKILNALNAAEQMDSKDKRHHGRAIDL